MKVKGKWLWIPQRITASLLLIDFLTNLFWWATNPSFSHQDLVEYLRTPWVALLKMLVVLLIVVHAGIGLWGIGTDYIRPMQFGRFAFAVRKLYELGCALLLVVVLYYGFRVLMMRSP